MSRMRQLRHSIEQVMRPVIHKSSSKTRQSGKKLSAKTVADRWGFFFRLPDILDSLNFGLRDIRNLDRRHIAALLQYWEGLGRAAGTMQTYVSMLRTLCTEIGKAGMLDRPETYFKDPTRYHRALKCNESKEWSDLGQDAVEVIAAIGQRDSLVGLQMVLMDAFGLRVQEAWLLRPKRDWKGDTLHIERGTKGGRPRVVPVINEHQRRVLEAAVKVATENGGSMVPSSYPLKRWRSYYYHVMAMFGVTRKGRGITSHGLRHGHLQRRYVELTGMEPPVKADGLRDRYACDDIAPARRELAEEAGHSRASVVSHYVGFDMDRRRSRAGRPRTRPWERVGMGPEAMDGRWP